MYCSNQSILTTSTSKNKDTLFYQPEVIGSLLLSPLTEPTDESPQDDPMESRLCKGLAGELALAGRGLGAGPAGPLTNLDSGRLAACVTRPLGVGSDIFALTSCLIGGVSLFSTGMGAFAAFGSTVSSENTNGYL